MRFRVSDAQDWRFQPGQVGKFAIGADDGVVRARVRDDLFQHFAAPRFHHVPMVLLQRRQINHRAIRRKGQPIASALVRFFPKELFGNEIEAHERPESRDKEPPRVGVGTDAFDVQRAALVVQSARRNSLHELVTRADVENQDSMPSVLQIVANARLGHIEQLALGAPAFLRSTEGGARRDAKCRRRRD